MPRTRLQQGQIVVEELREAEIAVEVAFEKVSRLNSRLPEHRRACKLSPTAGQAIFDAGIRAQTALVTARSAMGDQHHCLEELRVMLALPRITAEIGEDKPPKPHALPFPFDDDMVGTSRLPATT